ncbi:MAG: hypothetical protein R2856_26710 [Caldilineaceae bacterium]
MRQRQNRQRQRLRGHRDRRRRRNAVTSDITVGGHLHRHLHAGHQRGYGVIFDGAKEQNLALDGWMMFDAITVYTGTTLIETNSGDNVTVSTLTNYGVIRGGAAVDDTTEYYFGLAGDHS